MAAQAGVEVGRCELMDDAMVRIINQANGLEVRHQLSPQHTKNAGVPHVAYSRFFLWLFAAAWLC